MAALLTCFFVGRRYIGTTEICNFFLFTLIKQQEEQHKSVGQFLNVYTFASNFSSEVRRRE